MHELVDPGLPDDDPRAMYHYNLLNMDSATWYSDRSTPREVVRYVLEKLGVDQWEGLQFDSVGFATSVDGRFFMAALKGPMGSLFTVWPVSEGGVNTLESVLALEYEDAMAQLKTGDAVPGPVRGRGVRVGGQLVDNWFSGSPAVYDYINGAEVLRLLLVITQNDGA